jgi:hypothetical protein
MADFRDGWLLVDDYDSRSEIQREDGANGFAVSDGDFEEEP